MAPLRPHAREATLGVPGREIHRETAERVPLNLIEVILAQGSWSGGQHDISRAAKATDPPPATTLHRLAMEQTNGAAF